MLRLIPVSNHIYTIAMFPTQQLSQSTQEEEEEEAATQNTNDVGTEAISASSVLQHHQDLFSHHCSKEGYSEATTD